MKRIYSPSLIFSPGISGVGYVNLYGIFGFSIGNLAAIINQTKGVVIYSTASNDLRFTNFSGTTVYLNFDTSSMSSSDKIQIIYDDATGSQLVTLSGTAQIQNTTNSLDTDQTFNIVSASTTTITGSTKVVSDGRKYKFYIDVSTWSTPSSAKILISLQESVDSTNWVDTYRTVALSGVIKLELPVLKLTGTYYRFSVGIAGSSLTSYISIRKSLLQTDSFENVCQISDRSLIDPDTAGTSTWSLRSSFCSNYILQARIGSQTTASTIVLQFSDNGYDWVTSSCSITTVANSVVYSKILGEKWMFARAYVQSAGSGTSSYDVAIKGW